MYILPLELPTPPYLSRLSQSSGFEFPVTYSKFPLAIHFTYGNLYVAMLLFYIRKFLEIILSDSNSFLTDQSIESFSYVHDPERGKTRCLKTRFKAIAIIQMTG